MLAITNAGGKRIRTSDPADPKLRCHVRSHLTQNLKPLDSGPTMYIMLLNNIHKERKTIRLKRTLSRVYWNILDLLGNSVTQQFFAQEKLRTLNTFPQAGA